MARLSDEQWSALRADWVVGRYSNRELGEKYGTSNVAITKRAKKEGWEKIGSIKKEDHNSGGFIYVVTFKDSANKKFYKIGMAKNIEQRIQGLQTGNPFKLKIELCFYVESMSKIEREIHSCFNKNRKSGEWFGLSDKDLEYIVKRYSING